jgi:hypothetical protein
MKRVFGIVIICIGSLLVMCQKQTENEITIESVLAIALLETNEICFTDSDFEGYSSVSHEISLNKEGIIKWNSYLRYDSTFVPPISVLGRLYKKEFVLRIDNTEIYKGIFYSGVSSAISNGIIITDILIKKDSTNNRIQIDFGSNTANVIDNRNDPRIIELFKIKNKLIN